MTTLKRMIGTLVATAAIGFSPLAPAAQQAPDFTLEGRHGNVSLHDFQGKVVLIDFWASWCGPCRESFPWMNAMYDKYHAQGLEIVAINVDRERALAEQFLARLPASFTVAFDPTGQVPTLYNIMGMPSSFLIDAKGEVRASHIGFHSDRVAHYEASIRQLLNE